MKKSVWGSAVGLMTFIALAVYLPVFLNGAAPRAELTLHSNENGGSFELKNIGTEPLFYTGYSKDDCIGLKAEAATPGKTIAPVLGWCGTGLTENQLDPRKSVVISGYFQDETYNVGPVVVKCSVTGRQSDFARLKNYLLMKIPALGEHWSYQHPLAFEIESGEVTLYRESNVAAK